MTREHKLALLVGFGLVLVVGILISDHFSKARTAQLNARLPVETADNFGAVAMDEPDTLQNPIPGGVTDPLAAAPPPVVEQRPVEITMGGDIGERPRMDGLRIADGGVTSGAGERGGSLGLLGGQSLQHAAQMAPEPTYDEVPAAPAPRNELARHELDARPAVLPVSSGPLLSHQVAKGDNLTRITAKYYGDRSLLPLLQSYNAGRIAADGTIRLGATLLIPPKDVLTGRAQLAAGAKAVPADLVKVEQPKADAKKAAPPAAAPEKQPAKPSKPASRAYTVKSGDTLLKIAARQLGASGRWREIRDLNKTKLSDEDSIRVGMVLALPAE